MSHFIIYSFSFVVQFLSEAGLDGALIITTPQEVAILDVKKEIDFCRKVNLPILGIVENMSGFKCPTCSHESIIWPALTGGAEKLAKDLNVPLLGKIPLDPIIGKSCDEGINPFNEDADENVKKSVSIQVYNSIAQELRKHPSVLPTTALSVERIMRDYSVTEDRAQVRIFWEYVLKRNHLILVIEQLP